MRNLTITLVLLWAASCGGDSRGSWTVAESVQHNFESSRRPEVMAAIRNQVTAALGTDLALDEQARGNFLTTWIYASSSRKGHRFRLRFSVSPVGYRVDLECELQESDFWQRCPDEARAPYMIKGRDKAVLAIERALAR